MQFDTVRAFYTEDDNTVIEFYVATIGDRTYGVPADPANSFYIGIQDWLAAGNELTPA